jgi:uncharacterized protein (TIGR03086 family)
VIEILAALDMAQLQFEQVLRRVGDEQWVASHVVAGGNYFVALLQGASKANALELVTALDVLQPDPVSAFVNQQPRLRAAFRAPGALEQVGHHVIADMTGAQLLEDYVAEATVHSWDIARATFTDFELEPQLVEAALAIFEQLAPVFATNGFIAPSVDISADAPVQDRLVALAGRQP